MLRVPVSRNRYYIRLADGGKIRQNHARPLCGSILAGGSRPEAAVRLSVFIAADQTFNFPISVSFRTISPTVEHRGWRNSPVPMATNT
jgi:hypothetical protein